MKHPASPRVVALVGPQGVGKTTLFESLLRSTGAEGLRPPAGHEAGERGMTLELAVGGTDFLGERWSFIDCPGAPEFAQEARHALMVCDAAVVVCDGSLERTAALAPLFTFLDARHIPHLLFLNVLDEGGDSTVRQLLDALQGVSTRPLVLRELPLHQGGQVVGVVDLVSERGWGTTGSDGTPRLLALSDSNRPREEAARRQLLERLADLDDALLTQLIEDVVPSASALYAHLERALREDKLVPVFIGSARRALGLPRLLKGLRHEVPTVEETRARLGLEGPLCVQAFKTQHLAHVGKQSLVRVWAGEVEDGGTLAGGRVGGLQRVLGARLVPGERARTGEVALLGRVESLRTGDVADAERVWRPQGWPQAPAPLHQVAILPEKRMDDVKLSGALARLVEEDPSLVVDQEPDTQLLLLGGQGELHLREALERLRTRLRVPVVARPPPVPYRETVRRGASHHARFKRQSGGHGQFADVVVEAWPLPRGEGFRFTSAVVGGAVPRQYIPAVEEGAREGLRRGPLGFPVVDVAVTLTGGTWHSVDSSDQAFRTAGRLALVELLPKLEPVLLEPILRVEVHVPREATPRAQRLVSSRRGQILGFDAHPEVPGWDVLTAYVPQAEMQGFIVELRSATAGLGSFVARFERYTELVGKQAGRVVAWQPEASR